MRQAPGRGSKATSARAAPGSAAAADNATLAVKLAAVHRHWLPPSRSVAGSKRAVGLAGCDFLDFRQRPVDVAFGHRALATLLSNRQVRQPQALLTVGSRSSRIGRAPAARRRNAARGRRRSGRRKPIDRCGVPVWPKCRWDVGTVSDCESRRYISRGVAAHALTEWSPRTSGAVLTNTVGLWDVVCF